MDENTAWFEGIDPATAGFVYTDDASKTNALSEFKGYLANRGWDKADPKIVSIAAIKAHREAERHLGVPADQILRVPKDGNDVAGWNAVRSRLGVPADDKGYDFSTVKNADGTDLADGFKASLSKTLFDAAVSKDKAPGAAAAIVKWQAEQAAQAAAAYEAKVAVEKDALTQNWGNKFNANMAVAKAGMKTYMTKAGFTETQMNERIAAAEKLIGYNGVLEMFRDIGVRNGEDNHIVGAPNGRDSDLTRDQAVATLSDRMKDAQWAEKLQNGDMVVLQEFDKLTRLKAGRP